jgi:hypothetical protein
LQKESRLKPTIRKSGVLVHCDRPFLAARPHYFVDFAAAAAPRALLLIRPCAGALPKELALIDEQRVRSRLTRPRRCLCSRRVLSRPI